MAGGEARRRQLFGTAASTAGRRRAGGEAEERNPGESGESGESGANLHRHPNLLLAR
jgi:hypothetical protein